MENLWIFSGSKNINGKLAIQTNELKYDEFDFGSASIKGHIRNNIVKSRILS